MGLQEGVGISRDPLNNKRRQDMWVLTGVKPVRTPETWNMELKHRILFPKCCNISKGTRTKIHSNIKGPASQVSKDNPPEPAVALVLSDPYRDTPMKEEGATCYLGMFWWSLSYEREDLALKPKQRRPVVPTSTGSVVDPEDGQTFLAVYVFAHLIVAICHHSYYGCCCCCQYCKLTLF